MQCPYDGADTHPMVVMKLVVNCASEKRSKRQLLPTPEEEEQQHHARVSVNSPCATQPRERKPKAHSPLSPIMSSLMRKKGSCFAGMVERVELPGSGAAYDSPPRAWAWMMTRTSSLSVNSLGVH